MNLAPLKMMKFILILKISSVKPPKMINVHFKTLSLLLIMDLKIITCKYCFFWNKIFRFIFSLFSTFKCIFLSTVDYLFTKIICQRNRYIWKSFYNEECFYVNSLVYCKPLQKHLFLLLYVN